MASKRFRDAVGIDPDRIVSAAVEAALGATQSDKKRHHPGRVLAAGAALAAAAAVGQRRMPRLAKVPLRMGLHKLGDMTHVDELADALRDRLTGHDDEPDEDEYYDDEDLDEEDYDDEEEFDDEPRDEAEDLPEDEDEDLPEDEDEDEEEDLPEDEDEDFDDEDDEGFDDEPEDGDGPRGEGDDEEPEEDEPEDDLEDESDEEEPEDEEPEDDEDLEPEDAEPEEGDEDEEDDEQIAARSLDLGVSSEANGRRSRDRVPDLFQALRTPHRRAPVMRRGSLRVDPATRPPEPDESRTRDGRRGRSSKPKSKAARA